MQSEAFIKEEFNESCNFDVDDAITKLEKLGLVSRVSPSVSFIIGTSLSEV